MSATSAFQGDIIAVRAVNRKARMARAKKLVGQILETPRHRRRPSLALLLLLKDSAEASADWSWIHGFIGELPKRTSPTQEEAAKLDAFALANAGQVRSNAIAETRSASSLISGPTPERLGLLGGRYKRLIAKSASPAPSGTDDISTGASTPTSGGWSSTSTNTIARAIWLACTGSGSARATTSGRDRFPRWSSPPCERAKKARPGGRMAARDPARSRVRRRRRRQGQRACAGCRRRGRGEMEARYHAGGSAKSVAQVDDKERRLRLAAILTDLENNMLNE